MTTQSSTHTAKSNHNLAARVGRWSVQHRRKAILGWLAFVFVSAVIGFNLVPQKNIEPMDGMPGESGKAAQVSKDGHSQLVTFTLPGESKVAEENVVGALAAVDAAAKANPELRIEES